MDLEYRGDERWMGREYERIYHISDMHIGKGIEGKDIEIIEE